MIKKDGRKIEGEFTDDVPEGRWTRWDENGKKRSEAMYIDGKKDGPSAEWTEDGFMIKNEVYRKGKLVKILGLIQS